jgi:hypothetical protein
MTAIHRLSLLSFLSFAALAHAQNKAPSLPEVPEVLREVGATLSSSNGIGTLNVRSKTPLTGAQWDAIDVLKPKRVFFHGNALDDAGMVRLVRLDPVVVLINDNSILTGAGVAKFGEMKSLTSLATNHSRQPTPESKAGFSAHPTLESFSTLGPFCIEALSAPKLKSANLDHGAACDAFIATLANHPALETLSLGRYGGSKMTDASFASVATLKHLKKLQVYISAHTFEGGLHLLKNLPALTNLDLLEIDLPPGDLEKLQAALPNVKITHTVMTQAAREKREREAGKK